MSDQDASEDGRGAAVSAIAGQSLRAGEDRESDFPGAAIDGVLKGSTVNARRRGDDECGVGGGAAAGYNRSVDVGAVNTGHAGKLLAVAIKVQNCVDAGSCPIEKVMFAGKALSMPRRSPPTAIRVPAQELPVEEIVNVPASVLMKFASGRFTVPERVPLPAPRT